MKIQDRPIFDQYDDMLADKPTITLESSRNHVCKGTDIISGGDLVLRLGGTGQEFFLPSPPNLEFWGGRIGVLGGTHRFFGGTHRNACYNLYTARKHLHQRVICRWGGGGWFDPPK